MKMEYFLFFSQFERVPTDFVLASTDGYFIALCGYSMHSPNGGYFEPEEHK